MTPINTIIKSVWETRNNMEKIAHTSKEGWEEDLERLFPDKNLYSHNVGDDYECEYLKVGLSQQTPQVRERTHPPQRNY